MRSEDWDKRDRIPDRMPRRSDKGRPHEHQIHDDKCVYCGKTREQIRKDW